MLVHLVLSLAQLSLKFSSFPPTNFFKGRYILFVAECACAGDILVPNFELGIMVISLYTHCVEYYNDFDVGRKLSPKTTKVTEFRK